MTEEKSKVTQLLRGESNLSLQEGKQHINRPVSDNIQRFCEGEQRVKQNYGTGAFVVKFTDISSHQFNGILSYLTDNEFQYEEFSGLADLLFHVEAVCDEQGYPQRDSILRTMLKTPIKTQRNVLKKKPVCKTQCMALELTICMRQHSSMQGYINSGSGKMFFRSGIECMKLLNELVQGKTQKRGRECKWG